MKHSKKDSCPQLDPAQQLCPEFDSSSMKLEISPQREKMGIPVLDNCAEEHIQ